MMTVACMYSYVMGMHVDIYISVTVLCKIILNKNIVTHPKDKRALAISFNTVVCANHRFYSKQWLLFTSPAHHIHIYMCRTSVFWKHFLDGSINIRLILIGQSSVS